MVFTAKKWWKTIYHKIKQKFRRTIQILWKSYRHPQLRCQKRSFPYPLPPRFIVFHSILGHLIMLVLGGQELVFQILQFLEEEKSKETIHKWGSPFFLSVQILCFAGEANHVSRFLISYPLICKEKLKRWFLLSFPYVTHPFFGKNDEP